MWTGFLFADASGPEETPAQRVGANPDIPGSQE